VRRVRLGASGPEVAAIGFGAWGLSGDYGPAEDGESVALVRRALDLGVDLIDTADAYGAGHNERLVGRAVAGRREEVCLATKVGIVRDTPGAPAVSGRPDYIRSALAASLARLGVDHVDLLYLHRADPDVPIEETVGAMGELVREGKARFLGLSEVGPDLVRRAHSTHPIAAVQSEYSLWTRDAERGVLPALAELGIAFVAFSPLGRGFLAGALRSPDELGDDDFRRSLPRFSAENFDRNLELLARLRGLAEGKGATPAQLALAWLVARGVVPIPGTRRRAHLEANVAALGVGLSREELAELEAAFPAGAAAGARYPAPVPAAAAGGRS
jgi:aryl-alcohol dehydrogenase-like predicted oxidoreductase